VYMRGLFAACTFSVRPISARSGTMTVTGTYRPLDLSLSVVESANGFNLDNDGYHSLGASMTGTYTGVGYLDPAPTGNVGN
jgi:hypothetical protein